MKATVNQEKEKLLSVAELGRFLGMSVGTVRNGLRGEGALAGVPCLLLGNRVRFDLATVKAWLETKKK